MIKYQGLLNMANDDIVWQDISKRQYKVFKKDGHKVRVISIGSTIGDYPLVLFFGMCVGMLMCMYITARVFTLPPDVKIEHQQINGEDNNPWYCDRVKA